LEGLCDTGRAVGAAGEAIAVEVVVVEAGCVEVVGGGACWAHDSDTLAIGSFTGSEIDDSGVPGCTSTVNDKCWPPSTVTVTVHDSPDAAGTHTQKPAKTHAAVTASRPMRSRLAIRVFRM
jgi:hypothetical protein